MSQSDRPVLVVGGGLAGIAAALKMSQAGRPVTLLETSKRLGGRATSHEDPETGELTDNCQHVLMRCCTNLLDLYRQLGVADRIEWHPRLHFFDKAGHHDVLEAGALPAPLHLSGAMGRFGCLSSLEKKAIRRAMLAMLRMGAHERDRLHETSFADWLAQQDQPRGAIEKYWAVVVISALNQTPEKSAASYALQVFQEGFLAHRAAYEMGVSSVPLRQLYEPAVRQIEGAGGRVEFGAAVRRLGFEGDRVTGVELADGRFLEADRVVSALPFDRLDKIAPEALREADARLAGLGAFAHSPILGIHLWFERPVLDRPHMIFVDSPLQWVFNKGVGEQGQGQPAGAQHLHGVISAADDWVGRSQDDILAMARQELAAYLPAAAGAPLLRGRVIKEKRATFSPEPGIAVHRPPTAGAVPNLWLAGDWVDTGWPATMEGAVRSGYRAAAAASGAAPETGLVADLKPAWLCRLLGGWARR